MILMFPSTSKIHQYIFLKRKEDSEHDYHFKHIKEMNEVWFAFLKTYWSCFQHVAITNPAEPCYLGFITKESGTEGTGQKAQPNDQQRNT